MGNCQQCNDSVPNKTQEILTTKTTKSKQKVGKKLSKQEMKGVIKIQANFRGYVIRKKFQFKLSRSTAQKHSSSIINQKSSHNDLVIAETSQVKQNTLQIQQTVKRLPPRKDQEQETNQKQFCNADITININKEVKDDASSVSDLSRPTSNPIAISVEMNGLCFIPLQKKDQQLVQTNQQQKLPCIELQNGAFYEGQWKDGMIHGFGKYILSENSFYIGDWYENKPNGSGTFQHSNGDLFSGTWVDGQVKGKGKYTFSDGSYYDGEWKSDLPNGQGIQTYDGGWIYEGSFQEGFKSGFGKLIYPDGAVYEGRFENDLMSGFGTFAFSDGRTYTGEWRNGVKQGKGVFEWPDGRKYDGQYVNDLREGYGVITWPNGQKYLGLWKAGLQHGNGQIIKSNGATFRGKWIKGKMATTKLTTNTPAKVVKLVND
ncbi:unnamed protein product (macronuclear) [Paramecium tetraurelia]|uniref:MORN repeat protein n=1 Tax=Paramecium tetraurelia TaxID=5888 RepID=A0BHW8_PARTE|nr:uncharacterized protein GSPATT00029171001 [Paramecium tetraurelia]CAK58135.1 unnamed protein product [Paramecium tetraurelia]|eukprot:XP_001425533.1 hypothetical protein (macronuclear) [Paramecium tetraurelia strain d4-2]